jgi:hypothetical protein
MTPVFFLTAGTGGKLSFSIREDTSLTLSAVAVVKDGATFDFDSHDQRMIWIQEAPVHVWPVGNGTGVDWAGAVRRTGTNPPALQWSLVAHLAVPRLPPCTTNPCPSLPATIRVCFDARTGPYEPTDGVGIVHMANAGTEVVGSRFEFALSTSGRGAAVDGSVRFGGPESRIRYAALCGWRLEHGLCRRQRHRGTAISYCDHNLW